MLDAYKKAHSRSFAQRIGGRWVLSWQTFLLNALLSLLVLISAQDVTSSDLTTIYKWFAVWGLSLATVGTYLFLAGISVLRNRRKENVKVSVVVIVNLLIGVVYTGTSHALQSYFGLSSKVDFIPAITTNVILVLWWSLSLSIFMDIASESKQVRNELIEDAIQIRIAEMQESDIALRLRQEISQEVSLQLNESKLSLEAGIKNLDSDKSTPGPIDTRKWQEIAELLETIARDSIRPLSKNLWEKDGIAYPKVTWRAIFMNMLREQPFLPLVIALIDIVGAAPTAVQIFGFSRVAPLIVAATTLILGVGYLFNFFMRQFPRWHTQLFIMGIFTFEMTVVPVRVHFREQWIPGSASVDWQIWQIILGVIVIIMASGFSAFRSVDVQTKALFSHEVDIESTAAIARALEIAKFAQESSRILHGAIQSRLVSCAMVIEKAAQSGNRKEFTAALQEAYEVLNTPLPVQILSDSIAAEVDRKVALWHGLCEFTTEVKVEENAATAELSTVLGRIVEEGIANSIRHGKATSISIHVFMKSDNSVGVHVEDNGIGFTKNQPGIGSALLEQVTHGNWSIIPSSEGTKLTAVVSFKL